MNQSFLLLASCTIVAVATIFTFFSPQISNDDSDLFFPDFDDHLDPMCFDTVADYYNKTYQEKQFSYTSVPYYHSDIDESYSSYFKSPPLSCHNRYQHLEYISCQLGFSPRNINASRVLVINSHSLLGSAIVSKLKQMKIDVAEIKSESHIELYTEICTIINQINIKYIIAVNYSMPNLQHFCLKKPVLFVMNNNYEKDLPHDFRNIHFIRAPPLFGPEYMMINSATDINQMLYKCIRDPFDFKKQKYKIDYSKEYYYAADYAKFLIEMMNNYMETNQFIDFHEEKPKQFTKEHKENGILMKTIKYLSMNIDDEETNSKTTNFAFFAREMRKISPLCKVTDTRITNNENNTNLSMIYPHGNTKQVQQTLNFLREQLKPPKKFYASFITTVCDIERVIYGSCVQLKFLNQLFIDYPSIPLEIVYIYGKINESSKEFDETFFLRKNMRKHMKIITLSSKEVASLNIDTETSGFPEYKLRNIGIKQAHGEYIFCGSSDILFPYGFIDGVMRHLFSPGLFRTIRITNHELLDKVYQSFDQWNEIAMITRPPETNLETYHFINYNQVMPHLVTRASGDFEGTHRIQWYLINGYIETGQILHADSFFLLEFGGFMGPTIIRFLGSHAHIDHPKVSQFTLSAKPSDFFDMGLLCDGFFSKAAKKYRRDDWGKMPDITNIDNNKLKYTPITSDPNKEKKKEQELQELREYDRLRNLNYAFGYPADIDRVKQILKGKVVGADQNNV